MTNRPPDVLPADGGSPSESWSTRRRFLFRIGAALFGVQIAASCLDSSPAARAWAATIGDAVHAVAAAIAPALAEAWQELAGRSDAHAVLLDLFGTTLLAVGIAGLWSLLDRRQVDHTKLAGALRTTLRYLVAVVLSVYGGVKVVNMQFPPPTVAELLQPLGSRTSMGLLWTFMAVSPAYTTFTGLAEVGGAALLFWRRTTLLGALILCGVLANVVFLNFAYDVPVKKGSTMLLVAVAALASRNAMALFQILVQARPVAIRHEPPFRAAPWLLKTRSVLKPTVILLALLGPPTAAYFVRRAISTPAPLHGLYEVSRFVRDAAEAPPLTTDSLRWRRLVIGERGGAVLQRMDDRFLNLQLSIDPALRTLTLTGGDTSPQTFGYEERGDGVLHLHASVATGIQEVVLLRQSPTTRFRLLRGDQHR